MTGRMGTALLRDERGIALVTILVVMTTLTVLAVGLMTFSATEVRIADNQKDLTNALYVAEAGVNEVMTRMTMDAGTNVTVNGGTFDPHIGDDPLNPDPNWRTEVHLDGQGSLPAPVGTEVIVPTLQNATGWLHYGDTNLGLAPVTVEHKWVDLDADGIRENGELVLYDARLFPPENFNTGFPIDVITVPSIVNGSRRTVLSEVTRLPLSPKINSAVTSDRGVDVTGNMTGCGHNHRLNTPAGTKDPQCQNWEVCLGRTIDAPAGCLTGIMTTGDPVASSGSTYLAGFPTVTDTSSTNPFYNIEEYLGISVVEWDALRNRPDATTEAEASVMSSGIAVINPGGTANFNGLNSTGLIYINGDARFGGNCQFAGLIYVEGDCVVVGTLWMVGALIVRGATNTAFGAGNSTILYSEEAIRAYVGGAMPFREIAWKEQ